MQSCAALGDGLIDSKNASPELDQHARLQPVAQQGTLIRVSSLYPQDADFQFQDRDG